MAQKPDSGFIHESDPSFFNHLNSTVWLIGVRYKMEEREDFDVAYGSGFALENSGLIMAASHLLPSNCITDVVRARRMHEDNFIWEAKRVYDKPQYGIMLLKIQGFQKKRCDFVTLADDGSLTREEIVYFIYSSDALVWSFMSGKVAFPCGNDITLPDDSDSDKRCGELESNARFNTPRCRSVVDIWNYWSLQPEEGQEAAQATEEDSYKWNLHPSVPIIQTYGNFGTDSCGGPVFNNKGLVVAMDLAYALNYECAIHVSMLNKVYKDYKEELGRTSEVQDGGSSTRKGEKRNKGKKGRRGKGRLRQDGRGKRHLHQDGHG